MTKRLDIDRLDASISSIEEVIANRPLIAIEARELRDVLEVLRRVRRVAIARNKTLESGDAPV